MSAFFVTYLWLFFQYKLKIPPSTYKICPLTKSEALDAKKTAGPAKSARCAPTISVCSSQDEFVKWMPWFS